ncbi:MAG: hypothetical protein A2V77_14130 [Anaeromyxobacter sp. RBG_16_69_14]|nr:MAG: hypothetical protein A2V77_14130 [Anaeromyxobacter sp. RBG_16_69_14]
MKGRARLVLVGAVAAGLAAACAHPGPRPSPPQRGRAPEGTERGRAPEDTELGIASYYASSLHGRRTASGARYDQRAMTCAHRTRAFGTLLRVTDVESGRSVLVRVTDRGPFAPGRVIDLSLAAARQLGILERGVARVRVETVR